MNTAPAQPRRHRTRVRRLPDRAKYDRSAVTAILDAMPVCHVGYIDDGCPFVTPTLQWREGDRVYWHGSAASRMIRAAAGADVCLTVTLLDGLVLARSAFHHSVNYRSAMVFGRPELIADPVEKARLLKMFVERLYPGRWQTLRPMTEAESKQTAVLSMPIDEASAKVRSGPPKDDADDYAWPVWAGLVPLRLVALAPEPDPLLTSSAPVPAYALQPRLG